MKKLLLYMTAVWLAFAPAASAQDSLDALSYLAGKWSVTSSFYGDDRWADPSVPMRATADTILGGSFIRVQSPVSFPGGTFQFEMTLSYDRFHGIYRTMFLDDLNGYMDSYVGKRTDGVLSVSNAETGSSFPDGEGGVVIGRLDIEQSKEGFLITSFSHLRRMAPIALICVWSLYRRSNLGKPCSACTTKCGMPPIFRDIIFVVTEKNQ